MLDRIDHVGVATEDLEGAIALYEGSLGMPVAHRETVESQGVEAVLLDVGEGHVELLRPLGPDTPVGKYLDKQAARACTTSPTRSPTSTSAGQARGGRGRADRLRARSASGTRASPSCIRSSTGGVLTEIVEPAGDH